jgi:surfactin synthase thioesterase subunit/acyl carrier protein
VSDATPIAALSGARLEEVLRPKLDGTRVLASLTSEAPLEAFVCFSSLAALLGAGSAYAAANAYQDAWAASASAPARALSVAWGPWAGAGMASSAGAGLERLGVKSLRTEDALDALGLALPTERAQVVAAEVDWQRLTESMDVRGERPLLRELVRSDVAAGSPSPPRSAAVRALLDDPRSSPQDRVRLVRVVLASAARIMGSATNIAVDVPLNDLGFDSLMLVELRRALVRETGVELPVSLSIQRPSAAQVIEYVQRALAERSSATSAPASSVAQGECLQSLLTPAGRLFCFHEAAGSPIAFAPFARLSASAGVEVHGIAHLRGAPPSSEVALTYLAEATAYIRKLADLPFVFFGQSIGALHGWAVANELAASGSALPGWHVVSSSFSPRALSDRLASTGLADLERRVLGANQGASKQQSEDFRADLELWQHMGPRAFGSLPVPIAAFVGRRDHILTPTDLERWREYTSASFSLDTVPGDHFDLRDAASVDQLASALASLLGKLTAD